MITDTRDHILDFIRHLLSATTNVSLYGVAHPQVQHLSELAYASIQTALENCREFSLMVVDNELIVNGQQQESGLVLGRFVQILKSRGIGHVRVVDGIDRQELDQFICALASQGESLGEVSSSEHLRLGRVELHLDNEERARRRLTIPEMPAEELDRFMDVYDSIRRGQKLQMKGLAEVVSGFVDAFRQEGKPLLVMASLRDTDEYTFTHSANVCILNLAQAMSLGIEGPLLSDIGMAAMLHDIGKLFVPEEVLTKKDKLTNEEFELMQQHPAKGARYLLENPGVPRLAVATAFEHHMKFNFSGYPQVSEGWKQNVCSQMTTISDFFDALRTRRPYREPMELSEISGMMHSMMGRDFNPQLTSNFLQIIARLKAESSAEMPVT